MGDKQRKYYWIFISMIIIFACKRDKQAFTYGEFKTNYDSLKTISETHIDVKMMLERVKQRYLQAELERNQEKKEVKSSALFINIPVLEVPVKNIKEPVSGVDEIFHLGNLNFQKGNWLLLYDETQVYAIFSNEGRLDPLYLSGNLSKLKTDVLINADCIFKAMLTAPGVSVPISGIIYGSKNEYRVLSRNGETFPLEEIYKISFRSNEQFIEDINKSIKMLKRLEE